MAQTALKSKILDLESEIQLLKQALVKEPDFGVDEANWRKVRPIAKKTRAKLYRRRYGKG